MKLIHYSSHPESSDPLVMVHRMEISHEGRAWRIKITDEPGVKPEIEEVDFVEDMMMALRNLRHSIDNGFKSLHSAWDDYQLRKRQRS